MSVYYGFVVAVVLTFAAVDTAVVALEILSVAWGRRVFHLKQRNVIVHNKKGIQYLITPSIYSKPFNELRNKPVPYKIRNFFQSMIKTCQQLYNTAIV